MNPFEPKSILCGVDFSPASQTALAYTALFARAYGAQVAVMHSNYVELPAYLAEAQFNSLETELQAARASLQEHLREFATPLLTDLAAAGEYLAVDEPPVDGLLQTVEARQPDLVVLGSHGHNRLNQFLLGSVSSGVLREITVPLLVTRHRDGAVTAPQIQHILCPVNYTDTAALGLQVAAGLAQRLGARLSLLHSLEGDGHHDREAEHDRLCQWVPEQVQADCTWEEAPVVDGPAAEGIVRSAERMGADLIVIAGRRRSLLAATVLGATTERVVHHASCPVLTVVAP
jgi:nucleotide-binding universal stress UspA family protein